MTKQIKGWEDLVDLESEDYVIEIDLEMGSGWIVPKDEESYVRPVYLSTHSFYPSMVDYTNYILKMMGFDAEVQVGMNDWGDK